ncbi:MAG: EAL domain-containing protein [Terracidiphilus sp.]
MASQVFTARENDSVPAELPDVLRYMARQPILDLRGKLHAYELLYRNGLETAFRGDGEKATRMVLDNTVLFGMERLAGGVAAFVNCTAASLLGRQVEVLPPASTVLEVLESAEPTEELIAACRDLKKKGFRIALDDFTWRPGIEPLVQLADYIKVDFLAMSAEDRGILLRRLQGCKAKLVAEKIETQEDYRLAREEGHTFFQGYYFCRPLLLKNRKVPANCMLHMKILEQLQCDPLELHGVCRLVKRDPSLTLRLLRLANSPISAIRQEVRSIETAVVMMGDEMLRRMLTLAIATEWNTGRPPVILNMVFVRGRFCELAAGLCALPPAEQYLLGMLSLLPAMLRMPMEELALALPLREPIRAALQGARNREHILLEWMECHERGEWAACDMIIQTHGLNPEQLLRCCAEAMVWAEDALQSAG